MDTYATVQQVINYLNRPLNSYEQGALPIALAAASRWIDRRLNNNFSKLDPVAQISTRYFRGGYNNINVDHVQAITAVQQVNPTDNSIQYTYVPFQDYIAMPVNRTVKSYLEAARGTRFPEGDYSVAVTGLFTAYDYANQKYPDDIVQLTIHLGAVFLQNSIRTDGVERESIEGHTIQKSFDDLMATDPIVKNIIDARDEIWLED